MTEKHRIQDTAGARIKIFPENCSLIPASLNPVPYFIYEAP